LEYCLVETIAQKITALKIIYKQKQFSVFNQFLLFNLLKQKHYEKVIINHCLYGYLWLFI